MKENCCQFEHGPIFHETEIDGTTTKIRIEPNSVDTFTEGSASDYYRWFMVKPPVESTILLDYEFITEGGIV